MSDLLNCDKCNKVIDSFEYCGHCGGCDECCKCGSEQYTVNYHNLSETLQLVKTYLKESKKQMDGFHKNLYPQGETNEHTDWLFTQCRLRERSIKLIEDVLSDIEHYKQPDDYYLDSMRW